MTTTTTPTLATAPTLARPVPCRIFDRAAHVGTLNPADRQSWSYEGDGVSVSVHPEDWEAIAKLGGNPTWTLTRTDGEPFRLLDAHALTTCERGTVMKWAHANGWVRRSRAWFAPHLDDDGRVSGETRCDSEAEAREFLDMARDMLTVAEHARLRVRRSLVWEATPEHPVSRKGFGDPLDLTLTVWAQAVPNVDGVWWQDAYEPLYYSCPRGVLTSLDNVTAHPGWTP